jgi:hypothetical protein
MKYVEINKETSVFFSGPFECVELPDAGSMHTMPIEVDDSIGIIYDKQMYNYNTNAFEDTNDSRLQYLEDTDWYITRRSDTSQEVPVSILQRRQECRDSMIIPENN